MMLNSALRRNVLDFTPNTTRVKWRVSIFGGSSVVFSTQRNFRKSQSVSSIPTIRNPFSTSSASATSCAQKRNRISQINWPKLGPVYKQLLRDGPLDLAEASNTILSFEVVLSMQITAWCGKKCVAFLVSVESSTISTIFELKAHSCLARVDGYLSMANKLGNGPWWTLFFGCIYRTLIIHLLQYRETLGPKTSWACHQVYRHKSKYRSTLGVLVLMRVRLQMSHNQQVQIEPSLLLYGSPSPYLSSY